MAIIDYTTNTPAAQGGMFSASWVLTDGDTGQPLAYSNLADKTVHVFDMTGTITIEGSNDPRVISDDSEIRDAASWITLTDNFGEQIVFSSDGMKLIAEAPRYIRPTGGDGTIIILSNAS